MKTKTIITENQARADGALVLWDERKLPKPALPEKLTPAVVEELIGRATEHIVVTLAKNMDALVRQRLNEARPQAKSAADLLTTEEAAAYLHKSKHWLLKRNDIPYVRGIPNHYRVKDLDAWLQSNRYKPRAA